MRQPDVQKFFPSVDHEILIGLVSRKIKDPRVMRLVRRIAQYCGPQEQRSVWFVGNDLFTPLERPRGLQIGNQTSKFFGYVMGHTGRADSHGLVKRLLRDHAFAQGSSGSLVKEY